MRMSRVQGRVSRCSFLREFVVKLFVFFCLRVQFGKGAVGVEREYFSLFRYVAFGEGPNHGVNGLLYLRPGRQAAAAKQIIGLHGVLKEIGILPGEKVFDGGKPIENAHSVSR